MKRPALRRTISLITFVMLAFVFVHSVNAQSGKERREARKLIEQADQAMSQRNYSNAKDLYSRALALTPADTHARFWKGAAHAYLDEGDQALPEFNAALTGGYKKPLEVYSLRWRIHYAKKDFDSAYSDVQKGLQLEPSNREFQLASADLLYARGSNREALDAYLKALPTAQNKGDIYLNIARIQHNLGDPAAQTAAAQEAVNNGTRHVAEAFLVVGDGLQKQKKFDEAAIAYRKAISARPDSYDTHRKLAEIYRSQGRFAEAIDVTRKALALVNLKIEEISKGPTPPAETLASLRQTAADMYTDASWYYSLTDRHADAVDAADAAIMLRPEQSMAYSNLCRAYNDLKKPSMAVTACNNALRLNANDGETLFYLARAFDLSSRPAEASVNYKRAVKGLEENSTKNPENWDVHYLLGNAYFADNQRDKAITSYKRALQLNPRFAKGYYNLG
ncbi:MAG: tetratricopeptide repeat protein, partial [Acidobacteria bacterium]|nr:tetratricopeptide repeat protein [Acidobacteriota bacterium]